MIDLRDVLKDIGLQVGKAPSAEITIRSSSRKTAQLKAANNNEARDWADCIATWLEAIAKEK